MSWEWYCRYEKSWGVDYEKCGARSRGSFKNKEDAQKSANAHSDRTGHNVSICETRLTETRRANKKKRKSRKMR
jgi:hypothetical protein